jgi:hypothetical protein
LDSTLQSLIHNFDTWASTQDWHPINDGVMGAAAVTRYAYIDTKDVGLAAMALFNKDIVIEQGEV